MPVYIRIELKLQHVGANIATARYRVAVAARQAVEMVDQAENKNLQTSPAVVRTPSKPDRFWKLALSFISIT